MRRYELMLVLRPDVADDKAQSVIDRTTRQIVAGEGQIVKVAPWGRRRLAYPIRSHFEGNYVVSQIKLDPSRIPDLEGTLRISEEVLRHMIVQAGE